jgi:hypothetical protein
MLSIAVGFVFKSFASVPCDTLDESDPWLVASRLTCPWEREGPKSLGVEIQTIIVSFSSAWAREFCQLTLECMWWCTCENNVLKKKMIVNDCE